MASNSWMSELKVGDEVFVQAFHIGSDVDQTLFHAVVQHVRTDRNGKMARLIELTGVPTNYIVWSVSTGKPTSGCHATMRPWKPEDGDQIRVNASSDFALFADAIWKMNDFITRGSAVRLEQKIANLGEMNQVTNLLRPLLERFKKKES